MKHYQPKTLKELIDSLEELEKTYGPDAKIKVVDVQERNQAVYPYEINGVSVYGKDISDAVISIQIGDV